MFQEGGPDTPLSSCGKWDRRDCPGPNQPHRWDKGGLATQLNAMNGTFREGPPEAGHKKKAPLVGTERGFPRARSARFLKGLSGFAELMVRERR
jgi:hypothetical protein